MVVVASVIAGEASQRYGRRRTMLALGAVNIVALPVLTLFIARSDPGSTTRILLAACLLAFLANAAYSPVMIFLNERYPTAIRSRGTAVSWNTGFMLGGLLPTFVNLLSPTVLDIPGRLVAFLIAAVLCSLETRGRLDTAAPVGERQQA